MAEPDPTTPVPVQPTTLEAIPLESEFQHAPRALTRIANRRAWSEPRTRFWLLTTIALIAIMLYLFIAQNLNFQSDAYLLQRGTKMDALVVRVEADPNVGNRYPSSPPKQVLLRYKVGDKVYEPYGYLTSYDGGWVEIGKTIPIHVDPADPSVFTPRQQPITLLERTAAGLLLVPIVLGAAVLSLYRRRAILRTWRDGELMPALVLESGQVAVAPRCRSVKCTPTDRYDNRIVRAFVPAVLHNVRRGDIVWMIVPPGRGPAVSASWFAERN